MTEKITIREKCRSKIKMSSHTIMLIHVTNDHTENNFYSQQRKMSGRGLATKSVMLYINSTFKCIPHVIIVQLTKY